MTLESEFQKYRQSKKEATETIKQTSEGVQQMLAKLQERIQGGETTGNDILDHSITTTTLLPDANETIEHKFEQLSELKEKLQQHNGEFVLVITRRWERAVMAGRPGSRMETEIYLGVIKEPFLDLGLGLSISTDKYVVTDLYYREHPRVYERSMPISSYWLGRPVGEMPVKDEDIGCFPRGRGRWEEEREKEPAIEILTGDRVVSEWFTELGTAGLPFFVKLQSLLVRTIPLPTNLQTQVDGELKNQKLGILQKIDELIKAERIWLEKLAEIDKTRLPRISFPLDDSSYERTVREDEEDLKRIKGAPIRDEIKKTKTGIQHTIQQAIEMGMHKEPWIIVNEPTPGKKTEIDVPKLIRGYAEYYEVPIPQDIK